MANETYRKTATAAENRYSRLLHEETERQLLAMIPVARHARLLAITDEWNKARAIFKAAQKYAEPAVLQACLRWYDRQSFFKPEQMPPDWMQVFYEAGD